MSDGRGGVRVVHRSAASVAQQAIAAKAAAKARTELVRRHHAESRELVAEYRREHGGS